MLLIVLVVLLIVNLGLSITVLIKTNKSKDNWDMVSDTGFDNPQDDASRQLTDQLTDQLTAGLSSNEGGDGISKFAFSKEYSRDGEEQNTSPMFF